jgi:TRAP-type C4-dicarboxylate transport system permease small subunit
VSGSAIFEPPRERYGILEIVLGLLLGTLSVVVIMQVVLRYLTEQPLAWTEEGARVLFVWSCMLGAAVTCKRSAQFGVDYFTRTVKGRTGKSLRVSLKAIELLYYLTLTWSGILVTKIAVYQRLPILKFSMSYAYAALPIATTLMCVFTIRQIWRELHKEVT